MQVTSNKPSEFLVMKQILRLHSLVNHFFHNKINSILARQSNSVITVGVSCQAAKDFKNWHKKLHIIYV